MKNLTDIEIVTPRMSTTRVKDSHINSTLLSINA